MALIREWPAAISERTATVHLTVECLARRVLLTVSWWSPTRVQASCTATKMTLVIRTNSTAPRGASDTATLEAGAKWPPPLLANSLPVASVIEVRHRSNAVGVDVSFMLTRLEGSAQMLSGKGLQLKPDPLDHAANDQQRRFAVDLECAQLIHIAAQKLRNRLGPGVADSKPHHFRRGSF